MLVTQTTPKQQLSRVGKAGFKQDIIELQSTFYHSFSQMASKCSYNCSHIPGKVEPYGDISGNGVSTGFSGQGWQGF